MKQSLVNDKGMNATKPMPEQYAMPQTGPTQAPQEKLLAGELVSFKNAENEPVNNPTQYNFPH